MTFAPVALMTTLYMSTDSWFCMKNNTTCHHVSHLLNLFKIKDLFSINSIISSAVLGHWI